MNRWTSYGSPDKSDWLEIEFDGEETIGRVVLHLYDDRGGVQAPADYRIEGWTGEEWLPIPGQSKDPSKPIGGMANTVTFKPVTSTKIRVVFTHHGDARSGVTEIEVWGK
jgi:hypothetical protein